MARKVLNVARGRHVLLSLIEDRQQSRVKRRRQVRRGAWSSASTHLMLAVEISRCGCSRPGVARPQPRGQRWREVGA